jgi:glycosyltransferase involved in cell wall biosynthesis
MEDEETARRTMTKFDIQAVVRPIVDIPRDIMSRSFERFRHEFDRSYMPTDHYAVSQADRAKLQDLISKSDVVWVHTLRTAHWFRIHRWPHSVMDIDDLPSTDYRSRARWNGSLRSRLSARRMAWIWKRRESLLLDRFDVLTVCSESDKSCLNITERIHVIPNGANLQPLSSRITAERPSIGFIGNCKFLPNEQGLNWFIRRVWPLIKSECPSAQLRVVGTGSDGYSSSIGQDIVGLGWLADPAEEVASWSATIVPIKTGAGTRVKVAEGFARRCPVVSTPFGAFGYDVANGRELMLADAPEEFASACLQLIRCPVLGQELAERAHKRFLECWTWDSFQRPIEAAVEECLSRSRFSPSAEAKENMLIKRA